MAPGSWRRNAVQRGLKVKPWVKTSLAPGSMVVTEYLRAAGLLEYLAELGFNLVGYGCTTCIGNSGPLPEPVSSIVRDKNLVVASVLSRQSQLRGTDPVAGARELPGVAAAGGGVCARRQDADRPDRASRSARTRTGSPCYLRDIWPTEREIQETMLKAVRAGDVPRQVRARLRRGRALADAAGPEGVRFNWEPDSTYIRNPPFFEGLTLEPTPPTRHSRRARAGAARRQRDDGSHFAGRIDPADSPAGSIWSRTACRRATSTPTARAVATTK